LLPAVEPKYHKDMNLGMPEMLFIFLLALLLFGPKKLPQIGRELGKALTEFKRASNEFKNQLETEIEMAEASERHKNNTEPPPQTPLVQVDTATPSTADTNLAAADLKPAFDGSPSVAAEPTILPPAEPTVASSFGQPATTVDATAISAESHGADQAEMLSAAAPAPVQLRVEASEKASLRDTNA
jgi:TatA/E family protein of Tat protein translocase